MTGGEFTGAVSSHWSSFFSRKQRRSTAQQHSGTRAQKSMRAMPAARISHPALGSVSGAETDGSEVVMGVVVAGMSGADAVVGEMEVAGVSVDKWTVVQNVSWTVVWVVESGINGVNGSEFGSGVW